ncbi:hypothetical protein QQF73_04870 [Marinobacter sp. M216]|uniref:DUF2846 domain-containing protein n=1 Tax=Marinobacter albus TaxID=3030833 RepID=A0ABT7H9C3_9GAMM|nr:hypothetical protein [Marinobacter sp. M216]MDK9556949.1 hypothetical protein [Marinobacter sp. M216]
MKKTHCFNGLTLLAVALLAGCAFSGGGRSIDDPTSSLVFGYMDMEEAPTSMDYVKLQQVAPRSEAGYWDMGTDDGIMYNQYVPPGSFKVAHFGGSSFLMGEHRYSFPTYGRNATAVTIEVPGIYFIGAYAYQEVDTGFFEADKFSIEPTETPSEKELLNTLLTMDWVEGTQWESRIKNRLAELQ